MYGVEGNSEKMLMEAIREIEGNNRKTLEEAKVYCASRGVDIKTELLEGNIAETIIKYAKKEKADLIFADVRIILRTGCLVGFRA